MWGAIACGMLARYVAAGRGGGPTLKRLVVHGAVMRCSQGAAPASLAVSPARITQDGGVFAANIGDFAPMTNVAPFGACRSPANPQVAAATAAAQGVLTPMPCVPVTTAPWTPGAIVTTVEAVPALTADSTCSCTWGGTISIESSGSDVEVA